MSNIDLDKLKQSGEAPSWLTEDGMKPMSKRLVAGETPKDGFLRVAKTIASYTKDPKKNTDRFFDLMWNNILCLATPVATNIGTNRGLGISCFKTSMYDTLTGESGIYPVNSEVAEMSKLGGGVGVSIDRIRPKGSKISTGGNSNGVVPWMRMLDTTFDIVSQGKRRGSGSVSLNIEHPDWDDFIESRENTGDPRKRVYDLHISTRINDDFMERVLSGDPEARRKWTKLLSYRSETGESYIEFADTVNRNRPKSYVDKNFFIENTNICCLTGDTLVATSKGPVRIDSLVGEKVEIFDGLNWITTDSFKKYDKSKIMRVHIKDGSYVDCTPNHRWFVASDCKNIENMKYDLKYTENLKVGDFIEPVTSGYTNLDWTRITKIEYLEEEQNVYCPSLPTTGKFALANGLMTGNTEILQYTDTQHSVVCCLSSLNLSTYDSWKSDYEYVISTSHEFLDAVLSDFLVNVQKYKYMQKAYRGALKARAIGLGVLGWHDLLLSKNLPFDNSWDVMSLNAEIFRRMKEVTDETSKRLAKVYGEPEWLIGYGERNMFKLAVAPTKTNSAVSGVVGEGISPIVGASWVKEGAEGDIFIRNPYFEKVLDSYGKNDYQTWKTIFKNKGSVQHLDFLNENEKKIFLTAREIDQHKIVVQAAQRQQFIDQGQSLNLFFPSNASSSYINSVHLNAYKLGVKTLYYMKTQAAISGDMLNNIECESCEG